MSQFGSHQVIKELTHMLDTSLSCIDLVFTSQSSLIIDSGAHSFLRLNCHHQITYAKFNLGIIYLLFRRSGVIKMLIDKLISQAINEFIWQRAFLNINVNEKLNILNSIILNVFSEFIPHQFAVCDEKDPRWFNNANIKALIKEKKSYI